MSARLTTALLAGAALLAASAATAQPQGGLTIVVPPGPAPTADQAKDCIAAHWIGARTAQNPASPTAIAERTAAAAWVTWLSTTSGRTQVQLQPDVKQATDRLTVSLTSSPTPDPRTPILARCAAFERATTPAAVIELPATTGEHDEQVEEGAPEAAPSDEAAPGEDSTDPNPPN